VEGGKDKKLIHNDMNERIDIIKPHIRHFCKEGYLDEIQTKTLYDLSDQYQISRKDVDDLVKEELKQVKLKHIEYIYKESGQPDAALHDIPDLFTESKRQFPDMLNIGKLRLKLNETEEAPAFIPIKGCSGITLFHENLKENEIDSFLENIAIRLILSLPRGLAKLTLIDPVNMGGSFIHLSGLDKYFYRIIDDEKAILPFLQECSRNMASFNFNELGSKYADVNTYNKVNRSKARPYNILLCPSLTEYFDANAFKELERVFRISNKTGLFLLSAAQSKLIKNNPIFPILTNNTCAINQTDSHFEVKSTINLDLFNRGYTLYPDISCNFDSDTIYKINNEFDSKTYPITKKASKSDEPIRDMELILGKDEKGKEITIVLKHDNDNVLLISEQRATIDLIVKSLIMKISENYTDDKLKVFITNSEIFSEYADFLACNIQTNKYHYTYGLLNEIKNLITQRKKLFQEQSVSDFQTFVDAKNVQLPRILCVIDNINQVLDNDNLLASEIPQILDTLLIDSVKYGVHFILAGFPTNNLLKINLSDNFNYKIFASLSPRMFEFITANVIQEDDIMYAGESLQGIILKESSSLVSRFKTNLYPDGELDTKMNKSKVKIFSQPIVFMDNSDEYPDLYKQIKINDLIPLEDRIVIGVPRFYADCFYSLPFTNGENAVLNLLVLGNDKPALESLILSIKKANNHLLVCDVAEKGMTLIESLTSFRNKIKNTKTTSIVCLINMDELDYTESDMKEYVKSFVANASGEKIYLLFHAKSDIVFQTVNLGEITRTNFEQKIALKDAPDSLISPILYMKNNDFIKPPKTSLEIIYEGTDSISGFGIDNVWLFNNKE